MEYLINPTLDVKARNEIYANLTNEQKVVAGAQDALYWLRKGVLAPSHQYTKVGWEAWEAYKEDTLCSLLEASKQVSCQACGIGSLFMGLSHASGDCIQVREFDDAPRHDIVRELSQIMPVEQINSIEACFERWHDVSEPILNEFPYTAGDWIKEREFAEAHSLKADDAELLEAILENIIANNGTFTP